MSENLTPRELLEYIGILRMDLLFSNSKSEGFYPVLHTDDGTKFRLSIKGSSHQDQYSFEKFINKKVRVLGSADEIRGHLRIVIDLNQDPSIATYCDSDDLAK
jgi:hypothetical protein